MTGPKSGHPLSRGHALSENRLNPLGVEWEVAHALAGRMREGVRNRRDRGALRPLARSECALTRSIDQRDLNLRHLWHCQDRVVRPVARQDALGVELHL